MTDAQNEAVMLLGQLYDESRPLFKRLIEMAERERLNPHEFVMACAMASIAVAEQTGLDKGAMLAIVDMLWEGPHALRYVE